MRTELFDREIPDAFSAARLLERGACGPLMGVSTSLLAKYLFDRCMADPIPRDNLPAAICYTLDHLLKHDEPKSDDQAANLRRDYTRSLCAAAATAHQFRDNQMWFLLHCLKPQCTRGGGQKWPMYLPEHVLAAAAYFGKVELVTELIDVGTINVHGETTFGTPIECAVKGGNCDIVRLLLKHNEALYDLAPLSFAAEAGNKDMVRLLLKHMHLSASSFLTVISYASRGGHQELIDLMKKSWTDDLLPPMT